MVGVVKRAIISVLVLSLTVSLGSCSFFEKERKIKEFDEETVQVLEEFFGITFPEDAVLVKGKIVAGREYMLFLLVKYPHEKAIQFFEENPEMGYFLTTSVGSSPYVSETFADVVYSKTGRLDVFFAFDKEGEECLEFQAVDAISNYQLVWDAVK